MLAPRRLRPGGGGPSQPHLSDTPRALPWLWATANEGVCPEYPPSRPTARHLSPKNPPGSHLSKPDGGTVVFILFSSFSQWPRTHSTE